MNINAALGMVERPLQGPSREWLLKMAEAEDQCQSVSVPYVEREHIYSKGCWCNPIIEDYSQQSDECSTCGIGSRLPSGVCDHCNQPVVDPPRERDEVAELREQVRILNEICDDIRDTFGYSRDDMVDLTTYVAEDYAELKEQLSQATKERDEYKVQSVAFETCGCALQTQVAQLREQLATAQAELEQAREENHKVWNNLNLPCIVDPILNDPSGIDCTLNRSYRAYLLLRGLPQVQAEAAAMRRLLLGYRGWFERSALIQSNQEAELAQIDKATSGTAGRELLDEMQRKDGKIKQLEDDWKFISTEYVKESNERERMRRKCHTAKLAYVATLRGKIDPAWFGEPVPVWQYRRHNAGQVWRTDDGVKVLTRGTGWGKSVRYVDWQACCDDPETYPCDEHGNRIEESMNIKQVEHVECNCGGTITHMAVIIEDQAKRISDLERQLAEHKRDAELCRRLRALLQRKAGTEFVFSSYPVSGLGVSGDVRNLMFLIRDGGAK